MVDSGDGCVPCVDSLEGSLTIEVGAEAGVIVGAGVYGNMTFKYDEPIKFDYGTRIELLVLLEQKRIWKQMGLSKEIWLFFNNNFKVDL